MPEREQLAFFRDTLDTRFGISEVRASADRGFTPPSAGLACQPDVLLRVHEHAKPHDARPLMVVAWRSW